MAAPISLGLLKNAANEIDALVYNYMANLPNSSCRWYSQVYPTKLPMPCKLTGKYHNDNQTMQVTNATTPANIHSHPKPHGNMK